MKRILLVILALAIMVNLTGCIKKKELSVEEKKQKVMAHLKDKYKEEFVLESVSLDDNWSYPYDRFFLHPSNGREGEDTFVVRGSQLDDGSYNMRDGYFGILIRAEYEAVMSGFVRECYKDFKIEVDLGEVGIVFPERLKKETKVQEIYNKDEHFISNTSILVKQSEAGNVDENLKKIAEHMIENRLAGDVKIYVAIDKAYKVQGKRIDWKKLYVNKENLIYQFGKTICVSDNLQMSEVKVYE